MTIVRTSIRLEGSKEHLEGIALVDTGASVTIIDREVADKVGVIHVKRTLTLTTASGHKMEGELAVINKLIIEGEELPYAHLLILRIPKEVKEMLRSKELSDWGIIGLTTLELLNLMPDTKTGKLKKNRILYANLNPTSSEPGLGSLEEKQGLKNLLHAV